MLKSFKFVFILLFAVVVTGCSFTSTTHLKVLDTNYLSTLQPERKVGIILFEATTDHANGRVDPTSGSVAAGVGAGMGSPGVGVIGAIIVTAIEKKAADNVSDMIIEGYKRFYEGSRETIEKQFQGTDLFSYITINNLKPIDPDRKSQTSFATKWEGYEKLYATDVRDFIINNNLYAAIQVNVSASIYENDRSFMVHNRWIIFDNEGEVRLNAFQNSVGGQAKKGWFYYVEDPEYYDELMSLLSKNIEDFFLVIEGKSPVNSKFTMFSQVP